MSEGLSHSLYSLSSPVHLQQHCCFLLHVSWTLRTQVLVSFRTAEHIQQLPFSLCKISFYYYFLKLSCAGPFSYQSFFPWDRGQYNSSVTASIKKFSITAHMFWRVSAFFSDFLEVKKMIVGEQKDDVGCLLNSEEKTIKACMSVKSTTDCR